MLKIAIILLSFMAFAQASEPTAMKIQAPNLDEEQLSGVYLRGEAGLGFLNTQRGAQGGIGIGYKHEHFRGELTFDYLRTNKSVTVMNGMANLYYDFGTWHSLTPYVGAGLGVTQLEGGVYAKQQLLTSGLMMGVSYAINQYYALDAGYRYLNYATHETGQTHKHEARLGLRVRFD